MNNYFVKRASCFVLSLVLAASVVVSFFGTVSVIRLRSETFVADKLSAYTAEIKADIEKEITSQPMSGTVPSDALLAALDDGVMQYLINMSAHNIVMQSTNDFSIDETLYNRLFKNVSAYLDSNGISADAKDISNAVSLQTDVINYVLSSVGTTDILLFSLARSNTSIAVTATAIALAVICAVLIHVIYEGRHKKNSYYGMALATAGYVDIFATAFAGRIGLFSSVSYCGYAPFDQAVSDCTASVSKMQLPVGIALLAAGVVVLLLNYRYLKKKNDRVKEQRTTNDKMRDDYMKHYEQVNAPAPAPVAGEREETKLDF